MKIPHFLVKSVSLIAIISLVMANISTHSEAAAASSYTTYALPSTALTSGANDTLAMQFLVPDSPTITQDVRVTDATGISNHGDVLTAFDSAVSRFKHVDSGATANVYDDNEVIIHDKDNDNKFDLAGVKASGNITVVTQPTVHAMTLVETTDPDSEDLATLDISTAQDPAVAQTVTITAASSNTVDVVWSTTVANNQTALAVTNATKATSQIVALPKASLANNEYFVLSHTANSAQAVCFFFDTDGTVADDTLTPSACQNANGIAGGVEVNIASDITAEDVANRIKSVINTVTSALQVTAGTLSTTNTSNDTIALSMDKTGTSYNIALNAGYLAEGVTNSGFVLNPFSGGAAALSFDLSSGAGAPDGIKVALNSDSGSLDIGDRWTLTIALGDSIVVDDTTYRFTSKASNGTNIQVGATTTLTAANIASALDGDAGETQETNVDATSTANVVSIIASAVGVAGNSYVITTDGVKLTDTNLTNGTDNDLVLKGIAPVDQTVLVAFAANEKFVGTPYDQTADIYRDTGTTTGRVDREVFNALTLKNLGTVSNTTQITEVKVWYEDFSPSSLFNGTETAFIASPTPMGTPTEFVISGKDISLLDGKGLKVYVTVDTGTLTDGQTLQLAIPQFIDANVNGSYDLGDLGVFVASSDDGPTGGVVYSTVMTVGIIGQFTPIQTNGKNFIDTVEDVKNGDKDDFDDYRDDYQSAYNSLRTLVQNGITTQEQLDDLVDVIANDSDGILGMISQVIDDELGSSLNEDDFDDVYADWNALSRTALDAALASLRDAIPGAMKDEFTDAWLDIRDEIQVMDDTIRSLQSKMTQDQVNDDMEDLLDQIVELSALLTKADDSVDDLNYFFENILADIEDMNDVVSRSDAPYTKSQYSSLDGSYNDTEDALDQMLDALKSLVASTQLKDDFDDFQDEVDDALAALEQKIVALMPADYSQAKNVIENLADIRDDIAAQKSQATSVATDDALVDYMEDLLDKIEDATLEISKITTTLSVSDYEDLQVEVSKFMIELAAAVDKVDDSTPAGLQDDFYDEIPAVWEAMNTFLDLVKKNARPADAASQYIDLQNELEWITKRANNLEDNAQAIGTISDDDLDIYDDQIKILLEDMMHAISKISCEIGDAEDEANDAEDAYEDTKKALEDIVKEVKKEVDNVNDDDLDDDFEIFETAIKGNTSDSATTLTLGGVEKAFANAQAMTGCAAVDDEDTDAGDGDDTDTLAPKAVSATFQDLTTIIVTFDTDMNETLVEKITAYTLVDLNTMNNTVKDTIKVTKIDYHADTKKAYLTVTGVKAQPGENYKITLTGIKDQNDTEISEDSRMIEFIQPSFKEATEIRLELDKDSVAAGSTDFITLTAYLVDEDGLAVQNAEVTFEVVSGDGDLSAIGDSTTDQNGEVIALFTPLESAGNVLVKASIANNPELFATQTILVTGEDTDAGDGDLGGGKESKHISFEEAYLSESGSKITGYIKELDGTPAIDKIVEVLIVDSKGKLLRYKVSTDKNGFYEFDLKGSEVKAGESYKILVESPGYESAEKIVTASTGQPKEENTGKPVINTSETAEEPKNDSGKVLGASDGGSTNGAGTLPSSGLDVPFLVVISLVLVFWYERKKTSIV